MYNICVRNPITEEYEAVRPTGGLPYCWDTMSEALEAALKWYPDEIRFNTGRVMVRGWRRRNATSSKE